MVSLHHFGFNIVLVRSEFTSQIRNWRPSLWIHSWYAKVIMHKKNKLEIILKDMVIESLIKNTLMPYNECQGNLVPDLFFFFFFLALWLPVSETENEQNYLTGYFLCLYLRHTTSSPQLRRTYCFPINCFYWRVENMRYIHIISWQPRIYFPIFLSQ